MPVFCSFQIKRQIQYNKSVLYDILVSVEKILSAIDPYRGGVAELVDAADLKSVEGNTS